jgi:hypothetical protein
MEPTLPDIAAIDWAAPWLAPWRGMGEALAQRACESLDSPTPVADALNRSAAPGLPVHFVAQESLPAGQAYESFIRTGGGVPTRNNAHDFFNGLAWLHFPHIKTRLNQLQAEQIERMGVVSQRGSVRDAITVFDENAAFLQAPDAVWQALENRDWPLLFIELRPLWAQCQLTLFGHALLEKLITPRKPIVAHVYRCALPQPAIASRPALDAYIAQDLSADKLSTKPFLPMPVLGVPGWWAANGDAAFYADASVFRAPRSTLA